MVLSPENDEENEDSHPYWYARVLGENSECESELVDESGEELDEEDLGPEDGGRIDEDMVALGYSGL
jgi:hypothetical protein